MILNKMAISIAKTTALFMSFFLFLVRFEVVASAPLSTDISCLKSLKDSLIDPFDQLSNWDFAGSTNGFICQFYGIECWSPTENKVLSITLSNMGLIGQFPAGLRYCSSLTSLNISHNQISGPLPSDIHLILPYVTYLDLSNNQLTGVIPPSIAKCKFLNTLSLGANELWGSIPDEIGRMRRLQYFNVSANKLTGPVPTFDWLPVSMDLGGGPPCGNSSLERCVHLSLDLGNNPGLCGNYSLERCDRSSLGNFSRGLMTGWAASMSFVCLVCWFVIPEIDVKKLYLKYKMKKKKNKRAQVNQESPRQTQEERNNITLMMTDMEKYVPRMPFAELSDATCGFSRDKLIGMGKTGATYKATIRDGFFLAVKWIFNDEHLKRIESEILTLVRLRQPRMVPLIGFCLEKNDIFLVYRFMPNGNLYDWLHSGRREGEMNGNWPLRFKIALGVAEGLALLHRDSNLAVIHGAISSKCILLDKHFEPKISNFWKAKFIKLRDPLSMHRSIHSRDNEELESDKKDVYWFGIVLLELITGKEPRELVNSISDLSPTTSLSAHFSPAFVLDETLAGQGFEDEILKCLEVAADCLRFHPGQRPLMVQVHETLTAIARISNSYSTQIAL